MSNTGTKGSGEWLLLVTAFFTAVWVIDLGYRAKPLCFSAMSGGSCVSASGGVDSSLSTRGNVVED